MVEPYLGTKLFTHCIELFVTNFPNSVPPNKSSIDRVVSKFRSTGSVGQRCAHAPCSNDALDLQNPLGKAISAFIVTLFCKYTIFLTNYTLFIAFFWALFAYFWFLGCVLNDTPCILPRKGSVACWLKITRFRLYISPNVSQIFSSNFAYKTRICTARTKKLWLRYQNTKEKRYS